MQRVGITHRRRVHRAAADVVAAHRSPAVRHFRLRALKGVFVLVAAEIAHGRILLANALVQIEHGLASFGQLHLQRQLHVDVEVVA